MYKHALERPARRLLHGPLGSFISPRRNLQAESVRYFEASLDLLWAADLSGRFTHVNPMWERVLGYPAEVLRSRRLTDLVHPDDVEGTASEVDALVGGECDSAGFRNRCRTADGDYVWLQWGAHACVPDGVIQGVARSMAAQPKAERLAYELKRLEGRVAEGVRDLAEAHAETLQLLAFAAEFRDEEVARHGERVGVTAAKIAASLGLSTESTDRIREAAPLHDIGKLALPDVILRKGGRLSSEERSIMARHAELGARLLFGSRSPVLQLAGVIAASHHERWDGGGFPKGLAGTEIPLVGRVVAVADAVDNITHGFEHRPCTLAEVMERIQRAAGSRFDPGVVEALAASQLERG